MQRHGLQLLIILSLALGLAVLSGCPAGKNDNGGEAAKTAAAPPKTEQPPQAGQSAEEAKPPAQQLAEQKAKATGGYDPNLPLNDQFAALKGRQNQPEDVQQTFANQVDTLKSEGLPEKALGEGDSAPGFALPADAGGTVALETALTHGPVVLVFFRGGW